MIVFQMMENLVDLYGILKLISVFANTNIIQYHEPVESNIFHCMLLEYPNKEVWEFWESKEKNNFWNYPLLFNSKPFIFQSTSQNNNFPCFYGCESGCFTLKEKRNLEAVRNARVRKYLDLGMKQANIMRNWMICGDFLLSQKVRIDLVFS